MLYVYVNNLNNPIKIFFYIELYVNVLLWNIHLLTWATNQISIAIFIYMS